MTGNEAKLPIWMRPEYHGRRRPRFDRDQIAAAALGIADREGFGAVSMRRVAAELGAGTMTLYHYLSNKQDLLMLMDDAIMGEVIVPDGELPAGWREALAMIARRSMAAFTRHPWALEGLRGTPFGPNGMRHFEQSLQAVAGLDIPLAGRIEVIALVDDYVFGHVVRQRDDDFGQRLDPGDDSLAAIFDYLEMQVAEGDFPHIAGMLDNRSRQQVWQVLVAAMGSGRFERGLQRLLDGIALDLGPGKP